MGKILTEREPIGAKTVLSDRLLVPCPACVAVAALAGIGLLAVWYLHENSQQISRCAIQVADQISTTIHSVTEIQVSTVKWPDLPYLKKGQKPEAGKRYFVPDEKKNNPQDAWDNAGKGYVDRYGNIWTPHRGKAHGGDHWDVEHPGGKHTNVDREGNVIGGPRKDNFPNAQGGW